jgi:hypothetical protein
VGKTQLAVEFAYRYADRYDVVWWIPAGQQTLVLQSLRDLGKCLGTPETADLQHSAGLVLEQLSRSSLRWLLIYDNVNDPDDVASLQGDPPGSGPGVEADIETGARRRGCERAKLAQVGGIGGWPYRTDQRVTHEVGAAEARGEVGEPAGRHLMVLVDHVLLLSRSCRSALTRSVTWRINPTMSAQYTDGLRKPSPARNRCA